MDTYLPPNFEAQPERRAVQAFEIAGLRRVELAARSFSDDTYYNMGDDKPAAPGGLRATGWAYESGHRHPGHRVSPRSHRPAPRRLRRFRVP